MLPNTCHQREMKNEISVAENTVQKNFKASAVDAKFLYKPTSVNFLLGTRNFSINHDSQKSEKKKAFSTQSGEALQRSTNLEEAQTFIKARKYICDGIG